MNRLRGLSIRGLRGPLGLLLLCLGFCSTAQAELVCYPAAFQGRKLAACLELPGKRENSVLQRNFAQSTTQLLKEKYLQKGTVGDADEMTDADGSTFHQPSDNSATCTVYETTSRGLPSFDKPLFTMRAFWETPSLPIPSHAALQMAQEQRGVMEPKINPNRALEIGEFAISSAAKLGLADLKILLIAMNLFDRFLFKGRDDLVLTTRASGAWGRLYRYMGFQSVGVPFRHPRYPEWLSIGMRRSIPDMRRALQSDMSRSGLKVATHRMPLKCLEALEVQAN